MDWPLVLFLAVVAFFAYRGYKKGLLRSLSRVLSLLAGYTASILFTEQVSAILASHFELEGIVSFIVAALGLFIAAGIAVSIVFWIIARLMPAQETPSTATAFGGLAIGSMVGVIVAVVAVWSFTFVRDFRGSPGLDELAQTDKSNIETLANRVAGKAVSTAMSLGSVNPEVARLTAAVIEAPAEVSQHAQQLMSSDDLQALLADPQSQVMMDSGDANALRQLPAFQQLAKNPDFLALAKSAGLITDDAENSASSEAILAIRMTEIWGRVQRVKNDRRVQEILGDPEFQQKATSGNPLDMLTNPRLLELANIIFSDPAAPENASSEEVGDTRAEPDPPKESKKKTKIYSWTDENGTLHVSDINPDS
jgi:hypothetical protein